MWSDQSLLLIDPILLAFPILNWSPKLRSDLCSGWDLGVPLVSSFSGEIREETSLCFLRTGSPLELNLELSLEESTSLSLLLNSYLCWNFRSSLMLVLGDIITTMQLCAQSPGESDHKWLDPLIIKVSATCLENEINLIEGFPLQLHLELVWKIVPWF